jgi:hypothetical protein
MKIFNPLHFALTFCQFGILGALGSGLKTAASFGMGGGGGFGLGTAIGLGVADAFLGDYAAKRANQRNVDNYANRYQMMMEDLRKAGLNPILAGELGAGSVAAAPMGVNSGLGQNAANIANTMSKTELVQTQNEIQMHFEEIIDDFHGAWRNSGKTLLEYIETADWKEIGNIIGKYVSITGDKLTNFFKNFFGDAQKFLENIIFGKKHGGVAPIPQPGLNPRIR